MAANVYFGRAISGWARTRCGPGLGGLRYIIEIMGDSRNLLPIWPGETVLQYHEASGHDYPLTQQ